MSGVVDLRYTGGARMLMMLEVGKTPVVFQFTDLVGQEFLYSNRTVFGKAVVSQGFQLLGI